MLLIEKLKGISLHASIIVCLLAISFIGVVDYCLPPEVFTSLFYVLPIMLAGWTGARWFGVAMALVSGLLWLITDIASGHVYTHPAILPWNAFVRFTTFIIVALLTAAFRRALNKEELLADFDGLTGALNLRNFREKLTDEYERSKRYGRVFTLVCMDIDNFKQVNDTMGHQAGDLLLVKVVGTLKSCLRKSDLVARLGGDEFSVLLPETAASEAREALSHAVRSLLAEMNKFAWPVSFSLGAVTYSRLPESVDQVMKIADKLMYTVKNGGKNNIAYLEWSGDAGLDNAVD